MGFAEIIGQQRVIRLLQQGLRRGRLPHALLFTGMEGVGKRLTALTLAKAVNCQGGPAADCCGSCLSCRKAASSNHPDIDLVDGGGSLVKIDQIRALKQRLRFRPLEGRCRVTVICDAQNMKAEAANALLKVLEEPPGGNLIILTASETTALLPTIVSRCLHLRFQPLPQEAIAAHLCQSRGVPAKQAAVIAGQAGGSLSRALALLDEELLGRRRRLLETMAKLGQAQTLELLATAEACSGEGADLRQMLEWLKTWIRDLLVWHHKGAGPGCLLNPDFAKELAAAAPGWPREWLLEMFDLLCRLQGLGIYNINRRLTLETLLLAFQQQAQTGSAALGRQLAKACSIRSHYG